MAKSTHKGHCQACGRLQMAPGSVLAKHGYTVAHGYFSGVCCGSGQFPFELSCELIGQFIENAKKALDSMTAFQKLLRKPVDGPKAWFRVSLANPRGLGFGAVRTWKECTVEMVTKEFPGGSYNKFYRDGDTWSYRAEENGKPKRGELNAEYNATLADVCTKANRDYAAWEQHEVDSLRRYIAYQEERVRSWKVAPLVPVDAKDKEGFKPTDAPY